MPLGMGYCSFNIVKLKHFCQRPHESCEEIVCAGYWGCTLSYLTHEHKISWHDIRPSMVTHTRNSCSAFTQPKCTHTHTLWTHIRSSEQPFMLQRPGSSWGFGALLKGTSVVVLRVERALYIHSPHLQSLPARDSNSQPLGYESDSLTIRPRLPPANISCKIP